jgi:hypothetical protein
MWLGRGTARRDGVPGDRHATAGRVIYQWNLNGMTVEPLQVGKGS